MSKAEVLSGARTKMRRRRRCHPSSCHPLMLHPPQQRRVWHQRTPPRRRRRTVPRRRRWMVQRGPTGFSTRTNRGGGINGSPPRHQNHSTNFYHSHRQVKVNMTLKINLVLFSSISTSAKQRLEFSSAMSAVTAPAEIRTMVNTRSDWSCLFEEFLTKYNSTLAYFP